jgi:hypothetical protein
MYCTAACMLMLINTCCRGVKRKLRVVIYLHDDMSAAFHCMAVHSLSCPLLACRYPMQLFSAAPDICAQY